jgi:hypothetical protein
MPFIAGRQPLSDATNQFLQTRFTLTEPKKTEGIRSMKTNFRNVKWLIVLGSSCATVGAFGQTTYTWTGVADGTSLAIAGNGTTNGIDPATTLPDTAFSDTAQWDGTTRSNLVALLWMLPIVRLIGAFDDPIVESTSESPTTRKKGGDFMAGFLNVSDSFSASQVSAAPPATSPTVCQTL